MALPNSAPFQFLTIKKEPNNIYVITLRRGEDNKLNSAFCKEIIRAFHGINRELGSGLSGAVITRGNNHKIWSAGIQLNDDDPWSSTDGFYPMLATILDFPYPTIALLTGHTLGGACLFALAYDYRIMNSSRGFFQLPAIDLGLSFPGVGILPRLKLGPKVVRKLLLEAHRWTSKEACEDGVVDAVFEPEEMMGQAVAFAERWGEKVKGGAYGVLRDELWGEAGRALKSVSWVHRHPTALGKVKL